MQTGGLAPFRLDVVSFARRKTGGGVDSSRRRGEAASGEDSHAN